MDYRIVLQTTNVPIAGKVPSGKPNTKLIDRIDLDAVYRKVESNSPIYYKLYIYIYINLIGASKVGILITNVFLYINILDILLIIFVENIFVNVLTFEDGSADLHF